MAKKLIEVVLPLDAINKASAREKSIRHGHPSTLHLWWARRPLATARAVLFASLIDDPSEHPEKFPTPELQQAERKRLFKIIEDIVKWENTGNEKIFDEALTEIKNSVGEDLPAVFDPFAGGGTIPLEAQRLGLKSYAADLNPVAVMINKAMIEIPAKFKDKPPVNPHKNLFPDWIGAQGLADDILYYGKLLKNLAQQKIGKLYPTIDGKIVIAWLWARTVTCSNPACKKVTPLVHSFKLSTKQNVFVQPTFDGDKINFQIHKGNDAPEGTVNRNGARCLFCGSTIPLEHVRNEGKAGRLSAKLMAIVAESKNGRVYLPPNVEHEQIAKVPIPDDFPDGDLPEKALGFRVQEYGITQWHQLFTNRQLTALTTFSDLISDIKQQIIEDGGSKDYADAITVYLAFLIDKLTNLHNSFCRWRNDNECSTELFARQAIAMSWDFAESNPFSNSSGCFDNTIKGIYKSVKELPVKNFGAANLHNALETFSFDEKVLVSTDPPYYDNIGYANLSEFFYVWLRQSLKNIYPKLFGRMNFEKNSELIAEPSRFDNDKSTAKKFFEDGMFQALKNIYEVARADFPTTIYYAFKQQDSEGDGTASTGWEIMLTSIIRAGFQITATLPVRTEMTSRMRSHDSNALASSIVLACRKRPPENKIFGKSEFIRALKLELGAELEKMQQTTIAPVDMAQAAIGPGIAVYSRYEKIVDMNDEEVTVRDALKLINAELAEFFGTQTGRLDAASQFCVDLFTQNEFNAITFGVADVLARAKNISVGDLVETGAVISARGEVRLINREEMKIYDDAKNLKESWIEKLKSSNCAWLWVQSLVQSFKRIGIAGAAELISKFEGDMESLKNLSYYLYNICEKNNWAKEGTGYNELVMEWQEILENSLKFKQDSSTQGSLDGF